MGRGGGVGRGARVSFQEATFLMDWGTRPVGPCLKTAPSGRASLEEGPSPGFWHGESGDRNILSSPATPRPPPQENWAQLTPELTISASGPLDRSHFTPLRCLTIWEGQVHRERRAKKPVCPGTHSHKGLESGLLTLAFQGQCGIAVA